MKIILKIFSRNFLIRISYYLLPILKILYSGNKFIDPIDGKGIQNFYHMVMVNLEKMHYLLGLYLLKDIDFYGYILIEVQSLKF